MIYGVSSSRIRKLPEKMTSINFLSINVDYVSIFIQESEGCFFLGWEREGGERCKRRAAQPWRCTIYVI